MNESENIKDEMENWGFRFDIETVEAAEDALVDMWPEYNDIKEEETWLDYSNFCVPEQANLSHSFQADAMLEAYHEISKIVEQLPTQPRTIVDLACCGGFLSIYIAKRLPDSKVVGVDIAKDMMLALNDRGISPNLSFKCEDLIDA